MLLFGGPAGLFINVLMYLPAIIYLFILPYTGHGRDEPNAPNAGRISSGSALQLLRETVVQSDDPVDDFIGRRHIAAGRQRISSADAGVCPDFGHDKQDWAYSMLLGANAAGAAVGGLLLEGTGWLKANARNAAICSILWCMTIVGFAAVDQLSTLALALLFSSGVLNLAFLSMAQTLVQLQAPPQLRGRLIGLFNTSNNGLRAFSGVTVGVVGGLIGIHWSLAISAMALLAVTIALFALVIPGRGAE